MLLPSIPRQMSLAFVLLSTMVARPSFAATDSKPTDPCTIYSPSTGGFYDLRALQLTPFDWSKSPKQQLSSATNESYHARGYDYPYNFTMNFCGPVVEAANLTDVDGVSKKLYANISAYYKDKSSGDVFSLGQSNSLPIFRGRKLLLNYTHGSPCPDLDEDGDPISLAARAADRGHKTISDPDDDDDDDDDDDSKNRYKYKKPPHEAGERRKSTLLTFNCDTAPSMTNRPSIAFLGSPDHCTYVFEVRSRWACAGATPSKESGTLGPGGVFGVILGIAIAVYLIGGVVYQRSVMHQRGWRQLPNYGVWAGIWGFFSDMFTILFSSCTRRMPGMGRLFGGKRGGYHRVGDDRMNGSIGRGRTPEDENRLIDQLDEEWD